MRANHNFHPEFGWLAPTSRFRREWRIGFFSMLFGMSIGAIAVSALSVGSRNGGTNSESLLATRDVVSPSIIEASPKGAANKRPEPGSMNVDPSDFIKGDTDGSQQDSGRKNAGTACEGNKVGCLENMRRASGRTVVGSPAANDEPAIARAPLGQPEASAGRMQGSGRIDVAAQGSTEPERTTRPTHRQDVRPKPNAMSRVGRPDVRDSSSSPPGFWDWSR